MSHRSSAVLLLVALFLAGCGGEDVVDGPFITDWQLEEQPCAVVDNDVRCYDLTLTVVGGPGSAEASCDFSALDETGAELTIPVAVPRIEMFPIEAGDAPILAVELPAIPDDTFERWQVSCEPGAPG